MVTESQGLDLQVPVGERKKKLICRIRPSKERPAREEEKPKNRESGMPKNVRIKG